jgi:hypothetical protein
MNILLNKVADVKARAIPNICNYEAVLSGRQLHGLKYQLIKAIHRCDRHNNINRVLVVNSVVHSHRRADGRKGETKHRNGSP